MEYSIIWHKDGQEESVLWHGSSLESCKNHARTLLSEGSADRAKIYDQDGRMLAQFQNMVRNG